ncbi:hydroxypyruvate isomerase family protein [Smaragdicoccus niigatensis]|uniref:hydroxypyruvate isomerase family protein n=1 Tax=Smaragdicoccus niigatensis TaxID=359359 RepID=UPI00039D814E|nr:TIM barrel protein [Smaragdicoccus niigatensis]
MRYTVNCSILFPDIPLLDRAARAAAAGFGGVEFWWPFDSAVPSDAEVDAFVASIENAGVRLTGLNFAGGDLANGERGLLSIPARSQEFRDNIDVAIGIGERLGTRMFNALYGNRVDDVLPGDQDALASDNLDLAAQAAQKIGATVLVEPLSGAPDYPIKTLDDAALIAKFAGPGVAALADLYHLETNGVDVPKTIKRNFRQIHHVQIADSPGRGAPGTGNADLNGHLALLDELGYTGLISLEYVPGAAKDPFAWLPRDARNS